MTDHGDFEACIGNTSFSIDWGPNEDPETPGQWCAAVYRAPWNVRRPCVYVYADDKPELLKRATEAAHVLESGVDWRAEWKQLSEAVLREVDRCNFAARFARLHGHHGDARAYRDEAARLRLIHAGQSPEGLQRDLEKSLALVKGGANG